MMPFERFAPSMQDVVARTYHVSLRYSHKEVDTEHMLAALLESNNAVVGEILKRLNINISTVQSGLEVVLQTKTQVPLTSTRSSKVFLTTRARRMIDNALTEADTLGDAHIAGEHMLLAMTQEIDTPFAQILTDNGLTHDGIAAAIRAMRNA